MTEEEFCKRFVAHMVKCAGFKNFVCGGTVKEYAEATAPTYFLELPPDTDETPEECAETDISYWENE